MAIKEYGSLGFLSQEELLHVTGGVAGSTNPMANQSANVGVGFKFK